MFENIEDVHRELITCYDAVYGKYPVGQALFAEHRYFTNPLLLVSPECQNRIKEYRYNQLTHTPPYPSIDQTPDTVIDDFIVIDEEMRFLNASK